MMKKYYYFGIAAPIFYVFAVIFGGFIWPGYSQIHQAISELTMKTAPNQWIIQPLFWAYNILLILFAIGVFNWVKNKQVKASAIFLGICGLSGIAMFFFPQDPLNVALTFSGLMHFVLAGVASLTTLLAVFLGAFGFSKIKGLEKTKLPSLIFGMLILVSGPLTAIAPTKFPNIFGVFERFTIGTFMIWLFYVSYSIYRVQKEA